MDEAAINTEVFDLFEQWLDYHHYDTTADVCKRLAVARGRESYCIHGELHVDLSRVDHTIYIHHIASRCNRQGIASTFARELSQYCAEHGLSVYLVGPFTEAGRTWGMKMGLLTDNQRTDSL
jgi:hypothetical protein